ncbi:hypothetical protein PMIN01_07309 [Paraphaeosphaeria minitans]|uniref:Uncharacterized protein n=1 Tax=Paraphaeosphaeria minitans TaxID=565426 RepID=A0A9P6GEX4_9PLEO|nr:hypothetical protein PMIN01_07309 [Paraphaeosphaeria minitans]
MRVQTPHPARGRPLVEKQIPLGRGGLLGKRRADARGDVSAREHVVGRGVAKAGGAAKLGSAMPTLHLDLDIESDRGTHAERRAAAVARAAVS